MENALVIGGTGMLRGVVLKLLEDSCQVFVIARHRDALHALQEEAGAAVERLTVMAMDYHDLERLGRWIAHIQLMHGPLDRVIAWVHDDAAAVLRVVDHEVYLYRRSPWNLFHVVGSRAAVDPPQLPTLSENCRYHQVILGFIQESGSSRWLTHQEIVSGVYDAVKHPADFTVVGTVEPYENRP
ncbi:MAG: short-chain dehydrogenase [Firmicutes bacterium]|nr:short-chain dehydrogenase [Bacillota bacterium]